MVYIEVEGTKKRGKQAVGKGWSERYSKGLGPEHGGG